ncbi:MAG: tetratricopeptide repeat protein, partial [Gammaproteobacteria bacterium]|nr:tetratricopeptide repeat protein [Gammaproteobacteria bacterium]
MNPRNSLLLISLIGLLSGCASTNNSNTLASLNLVNIEIKDEKVEDGLNKALSSYEQFLKQAPESSLTPEAMRRLADLKIKKEYESEDSAASTATNLTESNLKPAQAGSSVTLPAISTSSNTSKRELKSVAGADTMAADSPIAVLSESEKEFSERASQEIEVAADKSAVVLPEAGEVSGAQEAIALYKKLLTKYPYYERNDQVLYQLSRAYEDLGEIEIAMKTLDDLVKQYPKSRHIEEANFRRGEYEFARKKYESSENYYQSI